MPSAVAELRDRVAQLPEVEIQLDGSSATGDRTALSDWDFDVRVASDRSLEPLAAVANAGDALAVFWDPLSRRANLIVLLDGPVKVDLIAADRPNPAPIERWEVTATTLPKLDAHFWDWTLWLGSKHLRGETERIGAELQKMHTALLGPLGAQHATDIASAIAAYLTARDTRAKELRVVIKNTLHDQVVAALRRTGVIST